MKRFRILFQVFWVAAAAVTGFRFAMGWTRTSIETYCPFGGLETAISLLTEKQFACATGERNLALFLALIILTLLSRKSFCGWVCPVGAISEWSAALGRKLLSLKQGGKKKLRQGLEPPPGIDRVLRWGRLPILILILVFTYKTGELIFRGYDPYYILFSFHGHDVTLWSYGILAVVLAGIIVFPMVWCRYLCPLGVALWPLSALGRLRVVRNDRACTACRACDGACPQAIVVSKVHQVRSGECTLCFECMDICPEDDALELRTGGLKR